MGEPFGLVSLVRVVGDGVSPACDSGLWHMPWCNREFDVGISRAISISVFGPEQLLLYPELWVSKPEPG
jgi:hypothetical protein